MSYIDDEVVEAASPLAQRRGCGLHPLDEAAAALALAPETCLAMDDGGSDRTLSHVVRRLDSLALYEGPHRWLRPQDATAHAGSLVPATEGPLVKEPDHSDSKLARPSLQHRAFELATLIQVPEAEDRARQSKQALTDPAQFFLAFGHAPEVADQVCEADLALAWVDEQVTRVAVADDHAGGLVADQFAGDGALARVADEENRRRFSDRCPDPGEDARLPPSGLIQVFRGRCGHGSHSLGMCILEPSGHPPLDVRDRAKREIDAVGVRNKALDVTPRHAVLATEQHDQRGEIRPEAALVNIAGQAGARRLTALQARESVNLVLSEVRLDRGDVDDLVAPRIRIIPAERCAARAALLRLHHLRLVDVIGRRLFALRTLVPGLPSAATPGWFLRGASRRPRAITRRRLARGAGRLGLASLQPLDLLPLLHDHQRLLQDKLLDPVQPSAQRRAARARRIGFGANVHALLHRRKTLMSCPEPPERVPREWGRFPTSRRRNFISLALGFRPTLAYRPIVLDRFDLHVSAAEWSYFDLNNLNMSHKWEKEAPILCWRSFSISQLVRT